ncbi:unnamed protein product [Prorocentrum cordatum]|uniref:Uncharacterized protein n=1 Tax=Prorocentrum cordatum TaxID=2364126 RepID=A0ABN9RLM5_9DINO|nr:unnamed protein product [Polarella glacialis]
MLSLSATRVTGDFMAAVPLAQATALSPAEARGAGDVEAAGALAKPTMLKFIATQVAGDIEAAGLLARLTAPSPLARRSRATSRRTGAPSSSWPCWNSPPRRSRATPWWRRPSSI